MTDDGLGRPLQDLRISVTDRCNFRCDYCMPVEKYGHNHDFLPKSEILSSLLPPADTVHSFVCPSVELVVKMRRDNASNKTRGYC